MKANYHTHTPRCKHARGNEEQYILEAINQGHRVSGFADHTPWHYQTNYHPTMRMEEKELANYVETLRLLKEKYKDQIDVKIGLECEYFPKYMDWLKQAIKDYDLDYIILGNHFQGSDEDGLYYGAPTNNIQVLKDYVHDVICAMETGLYSYVAHPDLVYYQDQESKEYKEEMSKICKRAKELDIPLEFNLLGYSTHRQYPNSTFWNIASKYQNKAILGIDAHDLFQYQDLKTIQKAEAYLDSLDVEVVDQIKFFK